MRFGNLGYTYYAERRERANLIKAIAKLRGNPNWSMVAAKVVYPEAKGDDLNRKAAEYEIYVEDIEDKMEGANAYIIRRFVEAVNRLHALVKDTTAAVAAQGDASTMGAFSMGWGLANNKKMLLAGAAALAAFLIIKKGK